MLDSGEADTFRYEKGKWEPNKSEAAKGTLDHPVMKGFLRRFIDPIQATESTGFFINTNKTADQNAGDEQKGYEIPWNYAEVIYWIEKFRNWQEKYNPILSPTNCCDLQAKHLGQLKSKSYLESLGELCFLFRDASARDLNDRDKPISESPIKILWYKLLEEFENRINSDCNNDQATIKLVHDYDSSVAVKKKTNFPLHSIRVSLITSLAMDAKVRMYSKSPTLTTWQPA